LKRCDWRLNSYEKGESEEKSGTGNKQGRRVVILERRRSWSWERAAIGAGFLAKESIHLPRIEEGGSITKGRRRNMQLLLAAEEIIETDLGQAKEETRWRSRPRPISVVQPA